MSGFFQIPPLHPILVHFPVALLPVAVVCDIMGRFTRRVSLTHAGWWTLLFATVAAPLTAASGWIWLREMGRMDQPEMVIHQWLGTAITLILIPLTYWRHRFHLRENIPSLAYLTTASIVLLALTVQGHLGGMITFGSTMASPPPIASTQPAEPRPPTSNSAGSVPTDDTGWSDSIHVKRHQHE